MRRGFFHLTSLIAFKLPVLEGLKAQLQCEWMFDLHVRRVSFLLVHFFDPHCAVGANALMVRSNLSAVPLEVKSQRALDYNSDVSEMRSDTISVSSRGAIVIQEMPSSTDQWCSGPSLRLHTCFRQHLTGPSPRRH